MYEPLSVDSVLGDSWVARLREDHAKHAYLTHGKETAMTATKHTPDNNGWVDHLTTQWLVAVHGGRAITRKVAQRVDVLQQVAAGERTAEQAWRYSIDPSTEGLPGDSGENRRREWRDIAERSARGYDASSQPVGLPHAEAMLEWPIYREALGLSKQDREDIVWAIEEAREDVRWNIQNGDYSDDDAVSAKAQLARWESIQQRLG